jgi:hypothetical protein
MFRVKQRLSLDDVTHMAAVPGWYSDPGGSAELRYWDGQAWTSSTRAIPENSAESGNPVGIHAQRHAPEALASVGATPENRPSYFYGSAIPSVAAPFGQGSSASGASRASGTSEWQPASPRRPRWVTPVISVGSVAAIAAVVFAALGVINANKSLYDRTSTALPKSVGGLQRIADVQANATPIKGLTKTFKFSGVKVGAYANSDGTPAAMVMVAHAKLDASQITSEMNESMDGFASSVRDDSVVQLTDFQDTAPGRLGGQMKCAGLQAENTPLTACFFMDGGAVGMVMTYGTSAGDQALILKLRSAIEKRS